MSHLVLLRRPTVRRIVVGGAISAYGDALQNAAQAWLAVQLTHSPRGVGLFALCWLLPRVATALCAGVVVDRYRRSTVLKLAVSCGTLIASLFFAFALEGALSYPVLLLLAAGFAVTAPFEIASRHSIVPQLVERDEIPSVIALVFTAMYTAELFGLVTGGLLLASTGVLGCVAANLATYAIYVALVAGVRSDEPPASPPPLWIAFRQGARFIAGKPHALLPLAIGCVFALVGFHFDRGTLPLFAVEDLHVHARTYGLLLAAAPTGAVLALGFRRAVRPHELPSRITGSVLLLGLCAAALALCTHPAIAFVLVLGLGAARGVHYNAIATLLQSRVPDELRGRVFSFYNASTGLYGLGGMIMGWLAPVVGVTISAHLLHATDPSGLRGYLVLVAIVSLLGAGIIFRPLRRDAGDI